MLKVAKAEGSNNIAKGNNQTESLRRRFNSKIRICRFCLKFFLPPEKKYCINFTRKLTPKIERPKTPYIFKTQIEIRAKTNKFALVNLYIRMKLAPKTTIGITAICAKNPWYADAKTKNDEAPRIVISSLAKKLNLYFSIIDSKAKTRNDNANKLPGNRL